MVDFLVGPVFSVWSTDMIIDNVSGNISKSERYVTVDGNIYRNGYVLLCAQKNQKTINYGGKPQKIIGFSASFGFRNNTGHECSVHVSCKYFAPLTHAFTSGLLAWEIKFMANRRQFDRQDKFFYGPAVQQQTWWSSMQL